MRVVEADVHVINGCTETLHACRARVAAKNMPGITMKLSSRKYFVRKE
jgi:hypothetical protein